MRKKAGLDPKTGYSEQKAKLCCPASTKNPEKNIGYLETSNSILKSLKEIGFDLENILEIEGDSPWKFISWNVIKTKIFDEIKKTRDEITKWKKYKILTYRCRDYHYSGNDVNKRILKDIMNKKDKRGKVFEQPLQVYGVFLGDDRIYVAVENEEVNAFYEFLDNVEETTNYVLSQKFPYDYILRWE